MTDRSYNGWPVILPGKEVSNTPSNQPRLRLVSVPGTDRRFWLADGPAAMVLAHWILFYHEKVQPINGGILDDWSYAYRDVREASGWSCHASGTAVDLNAVKHPLGRVGTFVHRWKVTRIHRRLARFYEGCIRWGGDYQGRKDEMHFEIIRPYDAVKTLAVALAKTPRGQKILNANPGLKSVI